MHFLKNFRWAWAVPVVDPATAVGWASIAMSRHALASSALGGTDVDPAWANVDTNAAAQMSAGVARRVAFIALLLASSARSVDCRMRWRLEKNDDYAPVADRSNRKSVAM
jgi:hypothetical protein